MFEKNLKIVQRLDCFNPKTVNIRSVKEINCQNYIVGVAHSVSLSAFRAGEYGFVPHGRQNFFSWRTERNGVWFPVDIIIL